MTPKFGSRDPLGGVATPFPVGCEGSTPQIIPVVPRTAREAANLLPIRGLPQPLATPDGCARFRQPLGEGPRVCDGCSETVSGPLAGQFASPNIRYFPPIWAERLWLDGYAVGYWFCTPCLMLTLRPPIPPDFPEEMWDRHVLGSLGLQLPPTAPPPPPATETPRVRRLLAPECSAPGLPASGT